MALTQFVGVLAEVAHLDPAFFGQGLETEVDTADIDADFFGQCPLSHARVVLDQLECPK